MNRIRLCGVLVSSLLFAAFCAWGQVPSSVYDRAVAAFTQQKYVEAEQTLRLSLTEHPRDARALGLMGVILDAQEHFAEAETYYQRALDLAPNSVSLHVNLGNHYLQQGRLEGARAAYLRATELDPADRNANSQLAQILVTEKKGSEALRYLDRLPTEDQKAPTTQLLRAQALKLAGDTARAEALLAEVLKQSGRDPRVAYSVGMLLAAWKSYARAEEAFSVALQTAPEDFETLYNLGLAALAAHDLARAAQAFHAALARRPNDVDCLIGLARISDEQHRDDQAASLLFQAQRAAPDRPDLLAFLANVLDRLGLYRDAVAAYDHCLKIQPADDEARRERGYALARAGNLTSGLQDLNWYTGKHPRDPVGWFELAAVESLQQRVNALAHLDRALELDPHLLPAHLARGVLLRQEGKPAQAAADLQVVLKRQPDNFRAWEELGEARLALGRTADGLQALKKAAELAPQNSEVLWRYAHTLMRAGQKASADEVLARVKSLGKPAGNLPPNSLALLNLDASGQPTTSVATLVELVSANPDDWRLKLRLGEELFSEGKGLEALKVFQEIRASAPGRKGLGECGRALLNAGQFKAAREFLEEAAQANSSSVQIRMDLSLATLHDIGPEAALTQLDKIPGEAWDGDCYLLRAQLLDALGRGREAAEALNHALQSSPTRADLYYQCALFLVKHDQVQQMIDFLGKADRIIPDNPQLLITCAIGLAIRHQNSQAEALLGHMESRWPEWFFPYLLHGIVLCYRERFSEAIPLLQTAIALGADKPVAFYHLADAMIHANSRKVPEARAAIRQALALDPKDPYIQSLAGKIAYVAADYPAAIEHLQAAIKLWPDMVEAHERLSATYRAMGEKDQSQAELKTVFRIKQQNPGAIEIPPFPADALLFTATEPASSP